MENLILKNDLILLNNKSSIYFYSASGTFTSIYLTVCGRSIFLDFSWKVGSDHFPIILENNGLPSLERVQRWRLTKANWDQFQKMCSIRLHLPVIADTDDSISLFTSILKDISVNDRDVTSDRDIANALADNFSHNSSSAFSTDAFIFVRNKAEKHNLNFSSENVEFYNRSFSVEELQDDLHRAHDTSAGHDEIHYQFLKHLPIFSISLLLKIFKTIWISGKDLTNPTNYRPIALTSCICKTMERMINRRLMCNVGSDLDVARLIILFDLKGFAGNLSSIIST